MAICNINGIIACTECQALFMVIFITTKNFEALICF